MLIVSYTVLKETWSLYHGTYLEMPISRQCIWTVEGNPQSTGRTGITPATRRRVTGSNKQSPLPNREYLIILNINCKAKIPDWGQYRHDLCFSLFMGYGLIKIMVSCIHVCPKLIWFAQLKENNTPLLHYFPVTAHPKVFYVSYTTAICQHY